jgi:Holliday junction resolvase RusA-like endonuclease
MRIVISQAPAKALLPNNRSRNHWSKRSEATRELRTAAKYEAYEQKPSGWEPVIHYKATIEVEWDRRQYPKEGDKPDLDGLLGGALKPAIDGLQDAGIIVDDKYAVEYTIRQRIGDTGRIIIDLEEVL